MKIWDGADQPWVLEHASEVRCLACGQLKMELVSPKRWRAGTKIVLKCTNDSCRVKNVEVMLTLSAPTRIKWNARRQTTPVARSTRKIVP